MKRKLIYATVLIVVVAAILSSFFTVDEMQIAIVSQFGNPVKVIDQPGLKVKLPAPFQSVIRFDKRKMIFSSRPAEFLTQDKKNIVVESFACWRIADATRFLRTVKNRTGAEVRLGDMINSEIGAALGNAPLSALISIEADTVQTDSIMDKVLKNCRDKAKQNYGIEMVAVMLKRINFPEQNKVSVYNRMRSERERIAKKYRAEGSEKAAEIRSETDREASRLISEAYRDAEKIKGEGDATAAGIYAKAFNLDPKFYKLTRTLESYKRFLDEQTTLVLSSDSELLKVLGDGESALTGK